jgi:beta-mannosidase
MSALSGERLELCDGWELAATAPGQVLTPAGLDALDWAPAVVPGTVAGALAAVGADAPGPLDDFDWWYRVRFAPAPAAAGEEVALGLGGLATVAEVYLNGALVAEGESMFAAMKVDVGAALAAENELAICFRALAPLLAVRRKPRARWRTRLVSAANLRFYRAMLLGRAPSFSPPWPVIGPWRPVWLERRSGVVLDELRLRARLTGADGVLECSARARAAGGEGRLPQTLEIAVRGPAGAAGAAHAELSVDPENGRVRGTVTVPGVEQWWPHTHGRPVLYDVEVSDGGRPLRRARVGFRALSHEPDLLADGVSLRVNGVPVFTRGAVWTPLDIRAPHSEAAALEPVLERVVSGGMNMLRVPGIAAYESDAFYDLCDELGILVWQDFMFANLDYPESDPEFMAGVEREARAILARLGGRPSLAVLCGGSEVAQQVAMMGLDPALAEGPLYSELLPEVVAEAEVDAPYVPSSPWGGELPFRTDSGVANYYGVGAYLRPLEDARRAEVRFAGECLAFSNVPDDAALAELYAAGGLSVTHPAWKAGVPRDAGAGWDFEDVRDHYLKLLFGIDPPSLRYVDQGRYLDLSRVVSGEVMAETFGEWRRAGSTCHGALVLWLKDLVPGAGWGVLDHRGEPKVAYHHLRRALAPVAVWTTDEGLGGIDVHVANDGPERLELRLRVSLYRDFEVPVDEASIDLSLAPHTYVRHNVEGLLGRFVDVTWAYRFGPPAQDLVAVTLERAGDGAVISQAFRFPAGRPSAVWPADALGLRGVVDASGPSPVLRVSSRRFAYGVRVDVPGFVAGDDAFGVEPGHELVVPLTPKEGADRAESASLTALNLSGRVRMQTG